MSESGGRWPWLRSIHADLLAGIAQQKPRAIVFDILFSDPDHTRPEGDAYFAEVIRTTDNTYFPLLRLNDTDDAQGIPLHKYGSVLGAVARDGAAPLGHAAMVLSLPVMLETGRTGLQMALNETDGVTRGYPLSTATNGSKI